MKYNKTMSRLVMLFLAMLSFSCSKFLDKKYNNSIASPTTLKDLQALLDNSITMNNGLTPGSGDASTDDYFFLDNTFNARTMREKSLYLWDRVPYNFPNDWSRAYTPIYISNYCIESLQKMEKTSENESVWNNTKGSAHFYRAYNFLNLLWNHAKAYDEHTSKDDLGIVLRLGADFNVKSERASVEASYRQVIEDAQTALPLLPVTAAHVFRPSQCAAYGLLARTYLSMRMYDSAYKYAGLVLNINNKLLNYSDLPLSSSPAFPKLNDEIIFYSEMYISGLTNIGRGYIDTSLFKSYKQGDQRKAGYFNKSGNYYIIKRAYAISGFFTGIATDEILLIKAECAARTNKKEEALENLNRLLEKRWDNSFTPLSAATSQEVLDMVLKERRRELIFRGQRWMDIKRLNKEGANINLSRLINGKTYNLPANDDYFALPLPEDIVSPFGLLQNP